MKIFNRSKEFQNTTWSAEGKVFTKAFSLAGISFLAICLVGFLTSIVIDKGGLLKGLANVGTFDLSIYNNMAANDAIAKLGQVSLVSMVLIFASYILRIVWTFRAMTASKTFIIFNYLLYIFAQGLGFGMMFTIWKTTEILIVFGVAGFLFALMALVGLKAKRLEYFEKLRNFIIVASIGIFLLSIFGIIFYFTIYSSAWIFAYFILGGLITLAYIVYDVWLLKIYARQIDAYSDPTMAFRIAAFFGFRLLTDLVTLLWTLLRLFLSTQD